LLPANLASSKGKTFDAGLMSPYFIKHFKREMKKCIEEKGEKELHRHSVKQSISLGMPY
jgi:hypothetical protein